MLDRSFIDRLFSVNGIDPNASDEELREVLKKARWEEEEIDAALMLIRNDKRGPVPMNAHHAALFSGDPRSLNRLSAKLAAHVVVDPMFGVRETPMPAARSTVGMGTWVLLIVAGFVLALVIGWSIFSVMGLGPYRNVLPF